jgi:hypothetical protein
VAVGTNVALVSLAVLSPQPKSTGIQTARRTFAADGTAYDEGKYIELVWDIVKNASAYTTILTAFGITTNLSANVTVYVRSQTYGFIRMNGVAIQPQPSVDQTWDRYFIRNLRLLVRDLSTAT